MNTSSFIKKYCKPTTKTATKDCLDVIMSHIVDYETIREYLVAIDYNKYLQTFYWKALSKYVRHKYKTCKCGEKENLHVHHNTYKFVGIEHLHINCLEVLCEKCHTIIHSCHGSPKSIDRGVGYEKEKDNEIKKYNSISFKRKSKRKPSGKSQKRLICELYVKNRMYTELKSFKKWEKSQKPPTRKDKYLIIKSLTTKGSK